jgi:hypothetical protein
MCDTLTENMYELNQTSQIIFESHVSRVMSRTRLIESSARL